jgi:hypothetical protein
MVYDFGFDSVLRPLPGALPGTAKRQRTCAAMAKHYRLRLRIGLKSTESESLHLKSASE